MHFDETGSLTLTLTLTLTNITTNATLEDTLNIMRENISSLEYEQVRGVNLTHGERQALIRLKEDNSLVINKADKGSTIVVQNHKDYALAGFKHLSDAKVYKPLNVDITPEVCMKLNAFLKRLYDEGLINKDMMDFCTPPNGVRTSRIYFLLKVHKNPMGIRPIVSGIKYATEFLSQFVDIWLQPLMQSLPSYIRDTTHFIKMIEETPFPKDCLMASIDVSSLYTNIIHEDGIESAINALHSTYATNEDQPPPEVIGEMLRFILTHNVIEFEGKYFLQLQGCTMGSKCSPSYACIYMGDVEKHLLFLADNKILFWKRYIDDIFLIYSGSTGDFQNYMKVINEVYETIKFTCEISTQQIDFLDTTVFKGPRFEKTGILDIKTHVKPTNKQLYVHAKSYHPKGCKKGIITGEALRYLRTNSNEDTFKQWMSKHKSNLKGRGYNPSLINPLLESITFNERAKALNPKPLEQSADLTFVNTYNDQTPEIRRIIYDNWERLHSDPTLKKLFPKPPILALMKNRTISNFLVKSKPDPWEPVSLMIQGPRDGVEPIRINDEPQCKITKCGNRRCGLCPILSTDTSITSKVCKRKHRIYGDFTCMTPRIVYLLECTRCGKQYVGQTVKTFKHRVAQHLLHIRKGGSDKLPLHFNADAHTVDDIIFHPIAAINVRIPIKDAESILKSLETVWIKRLATLQPLGLNFFLVDTQSRVIG